jgi:hypothetical protein
MISKEDISPCAFVSDHTSYKLHTWKRLMLAKTITITTIFDTLINWAT